MELPSVGTTRARRKLRPRGLARGEPRSNGTQPRRANSGNSHLRGGLGSGLRVAQTTRVRSTHPSRNCTLLPPRFHSLRLVADFLFPPTHTLNVDSWTLFSLTIGGVLLSFGIVAPMKSTVVQNWTNSPLWRPSGVDLEPQG